MDFDTSFGRWLRARRRALELTQADLGRRVGCAVVTVQKLEADERRPSRQLAERLVDSLEVGVAERTALISLARAEPYLAPEAGATVQQQVRTPVRPPTGLPAPLTRLIGRKQDLAAVRNALLHSEVRLLTLVGPPGIGKTRLSLEVARDVHAAFSDGTSFVALAPVSDPALVLATIARALEVSELAGRPLLDRLTSVLQAQRRLLVLDTFEQVLDAAPLVVELLEACPGLKALITSRAALHVRGERLYVVPPLLLPDLMRLPPTGALLRNPAVALFVERARAVVPEFRLTPQNAPAVAEICARLDGLPLAIELAAARSRIFTPEGLLPRLAHRLQFLTGGSRDLPARHQTLRATIDWSYALLSAAEQRLFTRLAVFVGGWTLEAAEAVCNTTGDLDVPTGLEALVDQHLVWRDAGGAGEPRFRRLESIRDYAQERLHAGGEEQALRWRHATYFLTLAELAEPGLRGPEQHAWLARLEAEHDNLRAALAWTRQADGAGKAGAELMLRLGAALSRFWYLHGYFLEWDRWFETALGQAAASGPTDVPRPGAARADLAAARANALLVRATRALYQFPDLPHSALGHESLALYRAIGDRWGVAAALVVLSGRSVRPITPAQRPVPPAEAVTQARSVGDPWLIAWARAHEGDELASHGTRDRAAAVLDDSVALARSVGDPWLLALCLSNRAWVEAWWGDLRFAGTLFQESLDLRRRVGDTHGRAHALLGLAQVAEKQGAYGEARRLNEERLGVERQLGNEGGVAHALGCLGAIGIAVGTYPAATAQLEASLAVCRAMSNTELTSWVLERLGNARLAQGDYARARACFDELRGLADAEANYSALAMSLFNLGRVLLAEGDIEQATARLAESVPVCRAVLGTNTRPMSHVIVNLGVVASAHGQPERATRLFAAAWQLRDALGEVGQRVWGMEYRWDYARRLEEVRAQVDQTTFEHAWQEGWTMPLEQVIADALEDRRGNVTAEHTTDEGPLEAERRSR